MLQNNPPTSQKSRPISFVLDDMANGRSPVWVPLVIRPEDLTRSEQSRMTLHQTLGRDTVGWVDNFGPGLPTINISGHTGWRAPSGQQYDGAEQFLTLHNKIFQVYHASKQEAIDAGNDPADVKLLFVDELDRFAYEVAPMNFTLRRSKSRPLLMQYSIQLQAVSTSAGVPAIDTTNLGDVFSGLGSLGDVLRDITGLVDSVVSGVNSFVAPIGAVVKEFMNVTAKVFGAVGTVVGAVANGVRTVANNLIGVARMVATAGKNVFDSLSAITSLPAFVKQTFQQVAAAYSTAFCLFKNSLRPNGKAYQDYSDLYGASNCSSTTGGSPASPLAKMNVFTDVRPMASPVQMSGNAVDGLGSLSRMDPVIAPMPLSEMTRNMGAVASGFKGFSSDIMAYGVSG